tara:strand:- start:98 stop:1180 length:1083 start_codon:yes stop_codon:yes gene_type:complete
MSTLYVNTITPNSGDTVTISGSLNTTGKFTVGDATSDSIIFNAEVSSSIVPDADDTYDLGSSAKQWKDLHVDGTGNIDIISSSDASIDNVHINGTASLYHLHMQDGHRISGSLVPSTDNVSDLGADGVEWKDLYIDGTAYIDTIDNPSIIAASITGADISGTGSIEAKKFSSAQGVASSLVMTGSTDIATITTASLEKISSSLTPSSGSYFDLGSSDDSWKDLHIDGTIQGGVVSAMDVYHVTGSSLAVTGVNIHSSVLASADAAHLGSADGFRKFSVQGQLQAAVADGATSAEFTVGNTDIALGDVIFGTVHGTLMGGLSQSSMIISTRTANSMSFVFNNESGLVAVDDSAFTASFVLL